MAQYAGLIQAGAQFAGSMYDQGASIADAKTSISQGYLTADANESRVRANSAQQLGEQRASAVESGFDANSGSLATLQTQSAGNLELDALNERYKGQINAWQQQLLIDRTTERQNFILDPLGNSKGGGKKTGGALGAFFGGVPGYFGGRVLGNAGQWATKGISTPTNKFITGS